MTATTRQEFLGAKEVSKKEQDILRVKGCSHKDTYSHSAFLFICLCHENVLALLLSCLGGHVTSDCILKNLQPGAWNTGQHRG